MTRTIARWILALALGTIGVTHFTQTRGFRVVVPDAVTRLAGLDKDTVVRASGAAEVALAAALIALPRQRRVFGAATAAFLAAVFPGNWYQWRTGRSAPGLDTDGKRFGRLFLQPVLIGWALWATR
ncbi:DoxX family protein [Microbacterium paraoxydans]|uniref:DoxX family protein n=1 Tax=Microbacterium paraoxydans TaxID=199592 RepID=UPI003D71A564